MEKSTISCTIRDKIFVLEIGAEWLDAADEFGRIYLMEKYGIDPTTIINANHNQIGYTNEDGIINDKIKN